MKLMDGERMVIGQETSDGLVVTSHRVRYTSQIWGSSSIQSIFLEDLSFVGIELVSYPVLLLIGGFALLAAVLAGMTDQPLPVTAFGLVVGGVLIASYFATRRQVLSFVSSGGRIELRMASLTWDSANLFIEMTEMAKNERAMSLSRATRLAAA